MDDQYYWSTGCAQFALDKSSMGVALEEPVPYKYIDNTWTKLSGCILTPLATTTWTDSRSGRPVLENGFLWAEQHTDINGAVKTSLFNTPNLKKLNNSQLLQTLCISMARHVGAQNAVSCQDTSICRKK